MRIETIPKKVFGSNENFAILRLLYNNGYDKFKREELDILLEVFNIFPAEQKYKLMLEDFEYRMKEEELDRKSQTINPFDNLLFNLYLPKLDTKTEFVFRGYNNFRIWFVKLDENHLITNYFYEKHVYFYDIYYYVEYFEYKGQLHRIPHILNYDLINDYPKTSTSNLTEIVKKDRLVVYLKRLEKRHGKPIYLEWFDEKERIELLDYFYPNVGGEKLLSFMKANFWNEEVLFDDVEYLDLKDFTRFLYLSKKAYKQLNKEV
jgi:hypothetical protein